MNTDPLPGYCPSSWDHQHAVGYPLAAICPFCGQEQPFITATIAMLVRREQKSGPLEL